GRIRYADLAREVGMSPSAVADRVRRLEEAGVIVGYTALGDPERVGLGILALIRVRYPTGKLRALRAAAGHHAGDHRGAPRDRRGLLCPQGGRPVHGPPGGGGRAGERPGWGGDGRPRRLVEAPGTLRGPRRPVRRSSRTGRCGMVRHSNLTDPYQPKDILRCLKRYLARELFPLLKADLHDAHAHRL